MPSVTYLKQTLQPQIAPGNDQEFVRLLTEADGRLLEWVRFRWTRTKITLEPTDGIITLPPEFASILGAQVDGYAADIHDESYEFSAGGVGDVEICGCGGMLIDQGINDEGLRHYKCPPDTSIRAWVNYAPRPLFDPEINDPDLPDDASDTTRCPSVAALKLACLGIIMEEADELEKSGGYFSTALRNLESKETSQRGGARPQVTVRRTGGLRGIRSFR